VDDVRVVEPRHEDAALRGRDHVLKRVLPGVHEQIQRRRAPAVRRRQGVARVACSRLATGGVRVICHAPQHPVLDQAHAPPGHPLVVERQPTAARITPIVPERDVAPADLLSYLARGEGAPFLVGEGMQVIHRERPEHVGDSQRLEDDRVLPGRQVLRAGAGEGLLGRALSKRLGAEGRDVLALGLCKAAGVGALHDHTHAAMALGEVRLDAQRVHDGHGV